MNHADELKKLTNQLGSELIANTLDLGIDYMELEIDSIFSSEITQEIPFVKTFVALTKCSLAIEERWFTKNLFVFLKEYHLGTIPPEKKALYFNKLNDVKYKKRVTETLIVSLTKLSNLQKSKILSNLFIAHIKDNYNWDKFMYFSDCLNLLFILDINALSVFYNNSSTSFMKSSEELTSHISSINRLEHLGFIESELSSLSTFGKSYTFSRYKITPDGMQFFESIGVN